MKEKMCSNNLDNSEARVEQSLLAALLHADGVRYVWNQGEEMTEDAIQVDEDPSATVLYPWNPSAPESEAFFEETNTSYIFEGWEEAEISDRACSFFARMNQVWSSSLQETLVERFAVRMPQSLLTSIAHQAQQIIATTQQSVVETSGSLAQQLVECVRELVPTLADEDFFVLARPLAVSMRNGGLQDAVDSTIAQVPQLEWEQLSDIQRARLSLAIARYAIDELQPQ